MFCEDVTGRPVLGRTCDLGWVSQARRGGAAPKRGRSYQRLCEQAAAPPDRIQSQSQSQEDQKSRRKRRKGEQKQTGFRERWREITDRNPAESPLQRERLRQDEAKPEEQQVTVQIRLLV